jgi:hypothetical protein
VSISAKVLVFERMGMRDVVEGGEQEQELAFANFGMKMG